MARVEFHTGVADPIGFACRLLRKAYRSGARVVVTAPPDQLAELDRALWTFGAQEFVPHVAVRGAAPSTLARTPIWLAPRAPADAPPVLVNLGAEAPDEQGTFDRVIEIVGTDEASSLGGRGRWRHYVNWGVEPVHHANG